MDHAQNLADCTEKWGAFLHNLMVYATIFKFVILLIWMPQEHSLVYLIPYQKKPQ